MSMFDDARDAGRLIALGMRPKLIPDRDLAYADLTRRYLEDDDFASLVNVIAEGLDLAVLGVTVRTGIVLAAAEGSVFEVRMDDYAKRASLTGRGTDKVLHGLAHLAAAALAYPRPDDLATDTYVGRVVAEEVDGVVREACRLLDEKAAAAEENHDPLDAAPELERAWRAYSRRPAAASTKDNRLSADSTLGIISKALRFLAEQGFLVAVNNTGGGTYRTTPRYQIQVRELAATAAFAQLLNLGVIPITDPTGSLHAVASETL
ncbi:MAG: hypothetical protein M3Y42_10055 [Actinomycetota bacterium]|nr:hypothetical protein [Actinomycetota bacterium]MDQ2957295.1 hypothetical protein [Actinomycetota bacterium]